MLVSRRLRIAYFAHSLRSDWNNGNAHFLRGLLREMGALGHDVIVFEPECGWSYENLLQEPSGSASVAQFEKVYPDLRVQTYAADLGETIETWRQLLNDVDLVIVHEWNPPSLANALLELRNEQHYRMFFHDTHHRASSSPEQMSLFGLSRFDGVLVFGDVLRKIYSDRFGMARVWTLHEAADISVFRPRRSAIKQQDVIWIGNWGDDERSQEISEFLLRPAAGMRNRAFTIYGVRYPEEARLALGAAGVHYGGYLPNLEAPCRYAESNITVHVPRQQYSRQMPGIPTIRVFEALACGIPLISAPWLDIESLFRKSDFMTVTSCGEMRKALTRLLNAPEEAAEMAERGLETVLQRHTCAHRAARLSEICQEALR
jgi:spore maturation protein CgeB